MTDRVPETMLSRGPDTPSEEALGHRTEESRRDEEDAEMRAEDPEVEDAVSGATCWRVAVGVEILHTQSLKIQ